MKKTVIPKTRGFWRSKGPFEEDLVSELPYRFVEHRIDMAGLSEPKIHLGMWSIDVTNPVRDVYTYV